MVKKKKKTVKTTKSRSIEEGKLAEKVVEKDIKAEKTTKKDLKKIKSTTKKAEKKLIKLQKQPKPKKKEEVIKETAPETATENVKETAPETKKAEPVKDQKIKGIILVLIGAFALIFIGYFLFGKLFSAESIAKISPSKSTIGFVEITVDEKSKQVNLFYELLKKYPVYQKENITKLVEYIIPYKYEEEIKPWLGRKVGVVFYMEENEIFSPVIFIESRDHSLTLEFLNKRSISEEIDKVVSEDFLGRNVYYFEGSQNVSFTFINNYLVLVEDKDVLKSYLKSLQEEPKLSEDSTYIKVSNNLPKGGIAFAYINYLNLYESLEKNDLFLSKNGQDLLIFKPFLNVFKAIGFSVSVDNEMFKSQSFTALNTSSLEGEDFIIFNKKYQGRLLELAEENPIVLMGGSDLSKEMNRIKEIFKSGTKTPSLVFDGIIEAQKQIYFGKDINLEADILPLLKGEYLFTVENSLEDPKVSIILEVNDKRVDIPMFERLSNAFIEASGIFTPKIREYELPDGTIAQELVASPEVVIKDTDKYKNNTLYSLKLGETGISIHYSILNDLIALSTSRKTVENIIDRYNGDLSKSFLDNSFYSNGVADILKTADEMFLLKIGAITGLNSDQNLSPYLLPFNNLTISKNYFKDGISTIYLIEVL